MTKPLKPLGASCPLWFDDGQMQSMEIKKNLNRIKAVLADAGQTNKWLADQLGKDPVTISKWCTNTTQPDLQTLSKIADLLDVDIRELLISKTK